MKYFISFIFYINFTWAHSAQVLVQSKKTSNQAFEAFINTEKNFISFSDWVFNYEKNSHLSLELLNFFKNAKLHLFNKKTKRAQIDFENIIKISLKNNWNLSERKMILFSHLYLYELYKNPVLKTRIINSAVQFDSYMDLNKGLFKKETRDAYVMATEKQSFILWKLPPEILNYDKIYINSKPQEISEYIQIPNSILRINLVSNKYTPITLTTEASNLVKRSFNLNEIVTGECKATTYNYKTQNALFALHPDNCLFNPDPGKIQTLIVQQPQLEKDNKLLKYSLIGLGLIATYYIIDQNKKPNEPPPKVTPTQTYGF